jgi:hypothetical protein
MEEDHRKICKFKFVEWVQLFVMLSLLPSVDRTLYQFSDSRTPYNCSGIVHLLLRLLLRHRSRDKRVDIATNYGLDDRGAGV